MAGDSDDNRLGRVQSLVRAFALLDILAQHDEGLTLTEIAQHVDLPRSTAHRLLTTMAALRYVEFNRVSHRWMIGIQAFTLGAAFVRVKDIGRLGRPIMRTLMLEAGEIVNIAISDDSGVRYVGQVRPATDDARSHAAAGLLPMHTTASGKALLAHWEDRDLAAFLGTSPLARRTASSIIDPRHLLEHLHMVRAQGFAVDDQENAIGTRCVAVPVFDRKNRVCASLSISGHVGRLPPERLPVLGRSLAAAARKMTEDIGAVLAA